jgi:hypothetical protein
MARSPAEIQADIAVTRRLIEHRLDTLRESVPNRWWTPYALLVGGVAAGVLLSRIPLFRLVRVGMRTVQTGLAVASTVAAVDCFLAERRRRAA